MDSYIDDFRIRNSIGKDAFVDWKNKILDDIGNAIDSKDVKFSGKSRSVFAPYWKDFQEMCNLSS